MVTKKVVAAVLIKNGRVLIAKRGAHDSLANKWELPGGKIEPGETPSECLKREMQEELRIDVQVGQFFAKNTYQYEGGQIELMAYFAKHQSGEITLTEHDAYHWAAKEELGKFDFLPADVPIIEKLQDIL